MHFKVANLINSQKTIKASRIIQVASIRMIQSQTVSIRIILNQVVSIRIFLNRAKKSMQINVGMEKASDHQKALINQEMIGANKVDPKIKLSSFKKENDFLLN